VTPSVSSPAGTNVTDAGNLFKRPNSHAKANMSTFFVVTTLTHQPDLDPNPKSNVNYSEL